MTFCDAMPPLPKFFHHGVPLLSIQDEPAKDNDHRHRRRDQVLELDMLFDCRVPEICSCAGTDYGKEGE